MRIAELILPCICALLLATPPASAGFVSGGLYATAENLNQVIQLDSNNSWSTALNVMTNPMGIGFLNQNQVYVTGTGPNWPSPSGQMIGYRSDGSVFLTVSNIPATNSFSNGSDGTGIAIDQQGNAYIATWNSPGATRVSASGVVSDWTGYQYGLWWGRAAAFSPTGQLYMIEGLNYGTNPTSTVSMIDPVTGAVTYVQQNVPFLNGLAIDSQGNMFLSEYNDNEIVEVKVGTSTIVPFASLAGASSLAVGPDGLLYAVSDLTQSTPSDGDQIWSFNISTGQGSLYASNLPYLTDIAFAPAVPEPSSFALAIVAMVIGAGINRLVRPRPQSQNAVIRQYA